MSSIYTFLSLLSGYFSRSVKQLLTLTFLGSCGILSAQVTVGFQGGEIGDPWGFTSTGASALSISEATQTPNKVTGATSLVVGGNTAGGNCFATGSGNGPATARTFTFNSLDITSSNASTRTLTFSWGNRYPACSGTGWDSGENLVFRAYHDGIAQAPVTLATGNNNAQFSILSNSYTWSVPPCVSEFHFILSITTNRADELLFIDNVKMTAPQLNGSLVVSPVSGNTSVCIGATETYSVTPEAGVSYTWSGLPAGASFTTGNGTTSSSNMTINWGTTPPGTYTLTVTPSNSCGGSGTPQTISITILPAPTPVTISGPASLCNGETISLTSSYTTGNSWSPNGETTASISVSAPGTYTVSVTTPCGIITASHTVTLNPVPNIQSVTPTPISCFGTNDGSLTIVSSDPNIEFSLDGTTWQAGNTFNNLAAGTYTPQVRFVNGCSTTLAPVIFTEPAAVTASASSSGTYCDGSLVFLHGTTTSSGTPTFSWTGPNSFTSTLQDPTHVAQTGTHTYQLIVSVNGCQSAPVSTTVTIYAIPVALVSNTGPYCAGSPIVLNSSTTSTGTVNYSWTGPNSYTSSLQNPANATAAGTYTLTISENGCQSAPVSTTVVIHPLPTAQASYVAPFCTGTTLQLNGSTTSTGTVTYSWTGPNGYSSTLQNPADGTAAGTYTLVVTESGCPGAPSSINVISEVPSLSVSNAGPYCAGNPIQLNGSTTSAGTVNYSWTGPNGYSSTLQNPSDATLGGIYTLVIQVGNCTNIASTVVTVKANPVAAFSASAPCMNDSVVFLSFCSAPSPELITSWHWDFNDGFTSSEQHPKHLFSSTGIHSVFLKVTTASNCIATASQDIEVKAAISANFHFSPSSISTLDPTVHFVNASSNATSYLWDFGSENTQSTESSPDFVYPAHPGSYTVKLVAYNDEGCKDSITKIITIKDEMIHYVPNAFTPDGDEFNQTFKPVFSSGFDPQNYTLQIYNRWGETIFESHDTNIGWDGSYSGELVVEGSYIWNITVKQFHSDAFETFSGHVTLIR
ncbi:PKD domain-containing protein [Fluviicola sp.]|uniref:PKD domain-containing protein n=1 Tax=Fluviicola sp. TaxID=1917219 RepID=UPI0026150C8D|nr:PKD domain-containing protein [Fluviicola sp.]